MLSMTKIIDSIIKLIRMFIVYVNKLISSPVVSVLPTIICAPIQLSARMQQYMVSCITGLLKTRMFSAFMNIFFRLPAAS